MLLVRFETSNALLGCVFESTRQSILKFESSISYLLDRVLLCINHFRQKVRKLHSRSSVDTDFAKFLPKVYTISSLNYLKYNKHFKVFNSSTTISKNIYFRIRLLWILSHRRKRRSIIMLKLKAGISGAKIGFPLI